MIPQHVGAYTQLVYTKSCIKIKPQFREASSAVTAKKRFTLLAPGSARSRHLAQFYSEPFRRSPATVRDAAEHGRPLRPQLGRSTKSFIWWEMDTVSHSLRRCWNKSSPIFTKSCPKSSHNRFNLKTSWLKIAQFFQIWVKSSQNSFYLKTRRFKIAQRHQNFGQLFQENLSPRTKKSPNLVTLTLPYKILWRYFATFGNILKSFGHFTEFWPNF